VQQNKRIRAHARALFKISGERIEVIGGCSEIDDMVLKSRGRW
jgi:hypothetical protein